MRIERATQTIQESIRRLQCLSFAALIKEKRLDSRDSVIYFLAILDLANEKHVEVLQDRPFADIILKPQAL